MITTDLQEGQIRLSCMHNGRVYDMIVIEGIKDQYANTWNVVFIELVGKDYQARKRIALEGEYIKRKFRIDPTAIHLGFDDKRMKSCEWVDNLNDLKEGELVLVKISSLSSLTVAAIALKDDFGGTFIDVNSSKDHICTLMMNSFTGRIGVKQPVPYSLSMPKVFRIPDQLIP